jgi:tetrahydromethanopterin S-methyltransferase subunit H
MAFPYGIHPHYVNAYLHFIKSNNIKKDKNIKILNQNSGAHDHLPANHIRKIFDIFGKNSGKLINYTEFLTNILNSEFVISTSGDRDDCFRHYECIGLNAIPVSNINGGYKDIFGENMVYSNAEEMIYMIKKNIINYNYKKPNTNILTISYWISEINKKINLLRS